MGFGMILVMLVAYLATLQTIPNGSDNYYMIDVGETQIVLNVWGTLHATGYPLYVMTGNIVVTIMKALGVTPATAPALVSLLWGIIALALIYVLAVRLSGRVILAAIVTILFGLTRTVWIHSAIAEIYSFGLVILALLLLLALWPGTVRHRIYWLAFIGGIGVAHHRAMMMAAPALLYAVWPELTANRKRLPRIVIFSLLLGLVGLLQYAYLPLRANAGAAWVYGEPGTFSGLWDQFIGREASRYRPDGIGDRGAHVALSPRGCHYDHQRPDGIPVSHPLLCRHFIGADSAGDVEHRFWLVVSGGLAAGTFGQASYKLDQLAIIGSSDFVAGYDDRVAGRWTDRAEFSVYPNADTGSNRPGHYSTDARGDSRINPDDPLGDTAFRGRLRA
jgi:hypothetical protein